MKNILIATDFDERENKLFQQAILLAKPFAAKVWILHVAAPDPDFAGYEAGPQFIREERALELKKEHVLIQKFTRLFKDENIESEGLLVQGATTETLMKEAKKLNIDLIIIGNRDHGWLHKLILGSVSDDVIKNSDIPVMLVPVN